MEVTTIGIDLAKRVFQVHGAASDGKVVFRKNLSRAVAAVSRRTAPVHGGDGSATAHDWGRTIGGLGHAVRLLPPVYVKSFVKRHAEAALRPTMRFVAVKTEEQEARSMIFRTRDLLVRQRTQLINALRGHLAEARGRRPTRPGPREAPCGCNRRRGRPHPADRPRRWSSLPPADRHLQREDRRAREDPPLAVDHLGARPTGFGALKERRSAKSASVPSGFRPLYLSFSHLALPSIP